MAELHPDAPHEPAVVEYSPQQLAQLRRDGPVPMTHPDSLDLNGAYARVFHDPAMGTLEARTRACLTSWFRQTLADNLERRPRLYQVDTALVAQGLQQWDALGLAERGSLLDLFNLSTDDGMALAHNRGRLQTLPQLQHLPQSLLYAVDKMAGFTMAGSGFPMSSSATGWWKGGFGFWSYLVTPECLQVTQRIMIDMQTRGLRPGVPKHFPHLIYKPVRGAALDAHHDQFAPAQLLAELDALLGPAGAENDVSTTAWVAKHGLQTLAHFRGGVGPEDGATFVVGPMPPSKLRFCLRAFAEGRVPGQQAGEGRAWLAKPAGKVDLDWPRLLPGFNQLLGAAGYSEIGLLPIAPPPEEAVGGACLEVAFPRGWPHGTFGMVGHHTRLTTTVPLSIAGSSEIALEAPASAAQLARIRSRLLYMADLSTDGLEPARYQEAESWLAQDSRPYAHGLTHKAPHKFGQMIRCRDAAQTLGLPAGHFAPLCASREDVQSYYEHVALYCTGTSGAPQGPAPEPEPEPEPAPAPAPPAFPNPFGNPEAAFGPAPPGPPADLPLEPYNPHERVDYSVCPPPHVLDENMLVLKVRQPFASALMGIKDVENRDFALPANSSRWVVIASSKIRPTAQWLAEFRARIRSDFRLGHPDMGLPYGVSQGYPHWTDQIDYNIYQHILGIVHITSCALKPNAPWPSVWHNQGEIGWYISRYWALDNPIPLDPSDGFQTSVRLDRRPQYRAALKAALARECGSEN